MLDQAQEDELRILAEAEHPAVERDLQSGAAGVTIRDIGSQFPGLGPENVLEQLQIPLHSPLSPQNLCEFPLFIYR
jgi:hypothetical protein